MQSRHIATYGSAAVMLMAIIANVRKAADVMLNLGRPGTMLQSWDAILAAISLEAGFALFAFFLAHEIRGRRNHIGLLVAGSLVMGILSAVANVAYYTHYSPAETMSWEWWQSIILGLSAPTVAIMTAVLAGVVESIKQAEDEQAHLLAQRLHEQDLALAKEKTAQARAAAREAKALSGKLPETSGNERKPAGSGRMTWQALLRQYPDAVGWTGAQIAEIAGVSARTGRNWLHRMKGDES